MKPLTCFIVSLLAFLPLTRAVRPVSKHRVEDYERHLLHTGTPDSYFFHILSEDWMDGRTLQLRRLPNGREIVVLDKTSPVLRGDLAGGMLRSLLRTTNSLDEYFLNGADQYVWMGSAAHMRNVSTTATSSLSEVFFESDAMDTPGYTGFALEISGGRRCTEYPLYHDTSEDTHYGWFACPLYDYTQLFYFRGRLPRGEKLEDQQWDDPLEHCERVEVVASVLMKDRAFVRKRPYAPTDLMMVGNGSRLGYR